MGFRRLVLVAPFWAGWKDLGQACRAYRELVERLSLPPEGGQAWFIHDSAREVRDRKLEDKQTAAGTDSAHFYPVSHWLGDQTTRDIGWKEVGSDAAAEAFTIVSEGLGHCENGMIPHVAADHTELMADQLNLFGVRFFFDQTHFDRFLCNVLADGMPGVETTSPYVTCIDLRFDLKVDAYWTFATLSLWSDCPQHAEIAPPRCVRATDSPPFTFDTLRRMHDDYETVTSRFECFLHGPAPVGGMAPAAPDPGRRSQGWSRPRLEVFDGAYHSPKFWFAVPADRPPSPVSYWDEGNGCHRVLGPLADCFLELSAPLADSVAVAQVQGDYLVQRRFIHDHHGTASVGDEPTYLLLPGQGPPEQQEETGYLIARSLLELEWHAATVLFEVDSELEVARTHIRMYEHNARQAGVLLDALVLHLPGISGKALRKAHEGIELVHQTLLQGIADLADMTTVIQASVRKVGDGADALKARFDRKLDQQTFPDRLGIRASLAEWGLFKRLEEQAKDDMALAERVQTRYGSLLQEITMAFEERRVREAYKLERYSGIIALLFGIVGVVTALEATFDFHWDSPPKKVLGTMSVVVGLGAVCLVGAIAEGLRRYLRVGRLGSKLFRQRYQDVWSFLATTSTDSLFQLKAEIERYPDDSTRLWNEADRRLSTRLARLWDAQPAIPTRRWVDSSGPATLLPTRLKRHGELDGRAEVERLAAQVETFVCETILVSERAPRLNRFALPRVTLLYRLLSATRAHVHANLAPRFVSDFDVCATLANAGFPSEQWETFLTWESELLGAEHRTVQREAPDGTDPQAVKATALLERINDTGLHHGLTAAQSRGVARRMWDDIRWWRASSTGDKGLAEKRERVTFVTSDSVSDSGLTGQ